MIILEEITMEAGNHKINKTEKKILSMNMEDGNIVSYNEDKCDSINTNLDSPASLNTNGYEFAGEPTNPLELSSEQFQIETGLLHSENYSKKINPLRIHLGKRPFVDNTHESCNNGKKKKYVSSPSNDKLITSRQPKLISKYNERHQYQHVTSQPLLHPDEYDKPVPRLVPKSQLSHFKKNQIEKMGPHSSQIKESGQNTGLHPMVKFKCRKCCSMSFKSLAMLKEHQLICRAQSKQPAVTPENTANSEKNPGCSSKVTRKVYLCSACGTYYENWNLFLHMREVHNRHTCLFCLGMFSKAEKLSTHLINKHNIQELQYNSKEEFLSVYNGTLYLMCCVCDEICSEKDDFFNHDCNNIKPKPVPVLISKNAVKPNMVKQTKNCTLPDSIVSSTLKDPFKTLCDQDLGNENVKSQLNTSHSIISQPEGKGNTLLESHSNSEDITSNEIRSLKSTETCTAIKRLSDDKVSDQFMPNGDDGVSEQFSMIKEETVEKAKEGGIKIKLSLSKNSSPVIINSTVDPRVGTQTHKSTKVKKHSKRIECSSDEHSLVPPKPTSIRMKISASNNKDDVSETSVQPRTPITMKISTSTFDSPPDLPVSTKTPSIKMKISTASNDNPFIKSTVYEESQDTILKSLLNNNLELPKSSENLVKSTIYDNKLDEDVNTLNRVPKLTVKVPKELLDKDSSSDYASDSDVSETKLTVDENSPIDEAECLEQQRPTTSQLESLEEEEEAVVKEETTDLDKETPHKEESIEPMEDHTTELKSEEPPVVDEAPATELSLDKPLDKYPLKELLRLFLSTSVFNCIYCNHVRKIAVNCKQLALHMAAEHRFSATVDSITAEELMPETIMANVQTRVEEVHNIYINLDSYDSENKCEESKYDHLFECFQCYFKTAIHKDLCSHNRKMHQKAILLCVMCKTNFYSYSELLCHLCPGTYDSEYEIKFRCYLCSMDSIPSSFRLMVHLRKIHHTCEVCLEFCYSQVRLSNHVWKHKLHHFCYRCGIAYRNKPDITRHLFWKHGTESVICKKCLQKKWPHVYHFCTPPAVFVCDECSLQFTRAVCLKVHKRFHAEMFPHICTELECAEKFVSKKLLMKHVDEHRKKLFIEDLNEEKTILDNKANEINEQKIPVIDLINDDIPTDTISLEPKSETGNDLPSKKSKKKKIKDALLLDVNLPALNLSESDSSDESDCDKDHISSVKEDKNLEDVCKPVPSNEVSPNHDMKPISPIIEENQFSKTDTALSSVQEDTHSHISQGVTGESNNHENKSIPTFVHESTENKLDEDKVITSTNTEDDKIVEKASEKMNDEIDNKSNVKKENILELGPCELGKKLFDTSDTVKNEKESVLITDVRSTKPLEDTILTSRDDTKIETNKLIKNENIPDNKSEVHENKIMKKDHIVEQNDKNSEKSTEQQALEIWDNFKRYQAKIGKQNKEKTPPLVPIKKHVCESDHDYCLVPIETNDEEDTFSYDKKKSKKSPKKKNVLGFTSSSSSSDSESSCSCGSNCSCSSSSGSSSSSSSDSDSSDESGKQKKKSKHTKKSSETRRVSCGSNVDVMDVSETPILVPDKPEPIIPETDLETEESETDEEFYDEHPQRQANKLHAEKRNQLMLLATVAPSEAGSMSGDVSRCTTPIKDEAHRKFSEGTKDDVRKAEKIDEKFSSTKKKKKKKKSKSSKRHGTLKINIPKELITKSKVETPQTPLPPNKITISLQTNSVQIPEMPQTTVTNMPTPNFNSNATLEENKRSSKRRRVPNKFYGYSSDEDTPQHTSALKPQLPPKLEWRKEDLPSPVSHKAKKEVPSTNLSQKIFSYTEPLRLKAPIPDPEPPRVLMNSDSLDSSDTDSSDQGGLEIYQPGSFQDSTPALPAPSYLNSGTSSLPYAFQRPQMRQAKEGESVYCYCRCPYDEVSEMIGCDAEGCPIEWFHFECVGIMVPPKGKWYCPECRKNQSLSGYR